MRFQLKLILAFIFVVSQAMADTSPWQDVELRGADSFDFFSNSPVVYRSLVLDLSLLEDQLNTAPLDPVLQDRYPSKSASGRPALIVLPSPDGVNLEFDVYEAPVMADALASQYPNIRSFNAQARGNPSITARLSLGLEGLRVMVLDSERGTWLIDPMHQGVTDRYASYLKLDYLPAQGFSCGLETGQGEHFGFASQIRGGVSNGGELRTYRLALAATGEYSQFHGGTLMSVMDQMNVAMTRVNGVYERDIGLRMEIIPNNDLLIYFDGSSDPYTNNSGGAMLGQNQSNIDSVIGSANYDIGHVFSTGGGGIAGLRVPCRAGNKARGVTGLPSPQNDVFYIDFVAHEMGHQWGGNHTFNGNAGSCVGGNRNASTAYEPGSGSTIQAYAGICGSNNLQSNSDDYFHGISLQEMIGYSVNGTGNTCAAINATANQAPVANAGADFMIPANTPFELCGSATDANSDTLTYGWEEFDLGPTGPPNNPQGDAAIFRSFQPSLSECRMFPQRSDVLNNTQTFGELMPSYSRIMTFRLSVRDNAVPAGGVSSDEMTVSVTDTGSAFRALTPTAGLEWAGNQPQQVSWDVAGTDQAPINCTAVDISLSTDGGQSFTQDLLLGAPNIGSATVTAPNIDADTARVEVRCSGNVFFSISPGDFSIRILDLDAIFINGFE